MKDHYHCPNLHHVKCDYWGFSDYVCGICGYYEVTVHTVKIKGYYDIK